MNSSNLSQIEGFRLRCFDGVYLNGVWVHPSGPPVGVALVLPGSGNVGTDGDVSGVFLGSGYRGQKARPGDQLAAALAAAGIASLRVAKRGFDDSTELVHQTMDYLIQDAKAMLAVAKQRFPGLGTVFVGLSEGALIATHIAAQEACDGLFLLSLPSRPIDETLRYQFIEWPMELLQSRDTDRDGRLSVEDLGGFLLPFLGPDLSSTPWQTLDSDRDGLLLLEDAKSAYEALYQGIRNLLNTPAFSGWYQSLLALPPLSEVGPKVNVPAYIYHGERDAQTRAEWVREDSKQFQMANLRVFPELGHGFSPMEGAFGEVKTSGPMDEAIIAAVVADVRKRCEDTHR